MAVTETVIDAINDGRDPSASNKGVLVELKAADASTFTTSSGLVAGQGEARCYVLSEIDHIALFLPKALTREVNCTLVEWSFIKLLPFEWYDIVFKERGSDRYRSIPEGKRSLEGYPLVVTKAGDPEHAAGFANKKDLRLVFYPNAFRFYWLSLHTLIQPAWPSARQMLASGCVLSAAAGGALGLQLDEIASPPGAADAPVEPWRTGFCSVLRDRHCRGVTRAVHPTDASASSPDEAVSALEACAPAVSSAALAFAQAATQPALNEVLAVPAWAAEPVAAACAILETFTADVLPRLPPDVGLPSAIRHCGSDWEKRVDAFLLAADPERLPLAQLPGFVASSAVSPDPGLKHAGPEQIGYTQIRLPNGTVRDYATPRFPTGTRFHRWPVWETGLDLEGARIHGGALPHCSLRWSRRRTDEQWTPSLALCECADCGDQMHQPLHVSFEIGTLTDEEMGDRQRFGYAPNAHVIVGCRIQPRRRGHVWVCPDCSTDPEFLLYNCHLCPGGEWEETDSEYDLRHGIERDGELAPAAALPSLGPPSPDIAMSRLRAMCGEAGVAYLIQDSRTQLAQALKHAHSQTDPGCDCEACDAVDRM